MSFEKKNCTSGCCKSLVTPAFNLQGLFTGFFHILQPRLHRTQVKWLLGPQKGGIIQQASISTYRIYKYLPYPFISSSWNFPSWSLLRSSCWRLLTRATFLLYCTFIYPSMSDNLPSLAWYSKDYLRNCQIQHPVPKLLHTEHIPWRQNICFTIASCWF